MTVQIKGRSRQGRLTDIQVFLECLAQREKCVRETRERVFCSVKIQVGLKVSVVDPRPSPGVDNQCSSYIRIDDEPTS